MPFPVIWPPPPVSGARSVRFFQSGVATANFVDNAWLFGSAASAHSPLPYVAPGSTATVNFGPVPGGGSNPNDAQPGASPPVGPPPSTPTVACRFHRVYNDGGGTLEVSYDGVTVHDLVLVSDAPHEYEDRMESGISVRGAGVSFRVVGW